MATFDDLRERIITGGRELGSSLRSFFSPELVSPIPEEDIAKSKKKDELISPQPEVTRRVKAGETPEPTPQQPVNVLNDFPRPSEIAQAVREFYTNQMPSTNEGVNQYYPVGEILEDMVIRGENARPGSGALLGLQAFFESTGGRKTNNLFGVKPRGTTSTFNSLEDAIDFQFGPSVLGGGANPNINVLEEEEKGPLTVDRIRRLYDSYDPPGAYLDLLLDAYNQVISQ